MIAGWSECSGAYNFFDDFCANATEYYFTMKYTWSVEVDQYLSTQALHYFHFVR